MMRQYELVEKVQAYNPHADENLLNRAYVYAMQKHGTQKRASGDPYFNHPLEVASILTDLKLDDATIAVALLHDTIEDTDATRAEIDQLFGAEIGEIVDGLTKIERLQLVTREEAQAENLRKLLLAISADVRVLLVKLADRLHNMRTLGAMEHSARRRIARETLEIYAPIAQRLGMNRFKGELQELGFRAMYPDRHRVIETRIKSTLGNRREAMSKIESALAARLASEGIVARVVSRIKSPFSIYTKMRNEHKSFAQVMDVYGFRVVTDSVMRCYHALGAVHGLYKPMDARFRDFIAIPKVNGYQSLHTVVFGPFGAPIEIQIRTEEMDSVAERGVAAHWAYKSGGGQGNAAQSRAREWVEGLVDSQARTASSLEFIENVKVDLFPDDVYLFSPKGRILALPRNATALDFAYAVHSEVGQHAVHARVDKKLAPLRTRLVSGQTVEIITAPSAQPHPQWLEWVVSAKARTAIRHHLKRLQHEDAVELGHRMLDRALDQVGISLEGIPGEVLDSYLAEQKFRRLEELLADIALGNRVAEHVATQLLRLKGGKTRLRASRTAESIRITGAERGVLTFANCCHPLPGDDIMGFMSAGKGIVVHRLECPNVPEFRKSPERCIAMEWDRDVSGDYKCELRVDIQNKPGVLASVAAAIAESNSNIENVEYQDRGVMSAIIVFTIEVRNRKHLADVMRRVRRLGVVHGVYRHPV